MSRELLLEKEDNPNYDELFSGKNHLDAEYNQMLDHDRDLNSQLESETHKLYAKFRNFKEGVKKRKRKRDRMLRRVLKTASIENHFMGNELPEDAKEKEVELGEMGLSVHDRNKELRKERMMGMRNIDDLKGLDIPKQISKRERMLRERNKNYFSKKALREKTPEERNLAQLPVKMTKTVKKVRNQSFLLRNAPFKEKNGSFKSERGLRQVRTFKKRRNKKSKSNRKLASKKPKNNKKKKSKKKKKKKLVKKFKKQYKFDWRTLKWVVKKKYKYTLITSVKDLKFWRKMGIKIKKHKVKLFFRWDTNRKIKKTQRTCLLTVRFSPLTYFWDIKYYYVKATFKSNCYKYSAEKVFKSYYNWGRNLVIYIGNFRFSVNFHWRIYKYGWYNRQYLYMNMFPRFMTKSFNPWKKPTDYIKFGLAPGTAKKWKKNRFKLFLKYQHHYPTKTKKQGQQAHEKVLKAKWVRRYGTRVPYKPKYRQLRQINIKKKSVDVKKKEIAPQERKLRQVGRKLYRRIYWLHRWQYMWFSGYRH